jgi:hypothetical protein
MMLADMPPPPSIASRAQLNPKSDDLKRLRHDINKELLSSQCRKRSVLRSSQSPALISHFADARPSSEFPLIGERDKVSEG